MGGREVKKKRKCVSNTGIVGKKNERVSIFIAIAPTNHPKGEVETKEL